MLQSKISNLKSKIDWPLFPVIKGMEGCNPQTADWAIAFLVKVPQVRSIDLRFEIWDFISNPLTSELLSLSSLSLCPLCPLWFNHSDITGIDIRLNNWPLFPAIKLIEGCNRQTADWPKTADWPIAFLVKVPQVQSGFNRKSKIENRKSIDLCSRLLRGSRTLIVKQQTERSHFWWKFHKCDRPILDLGFWIFDWIVDLCSRLLRGSRTLIVKQQTERSHFWWKFRKCDRVLIENLKSKI